MPTVLSYRGQDEATYQIPFAPPPAGHELASIPDLPPICITSLCILHLAFHFSLFDIPRNTDISYTLAGVLRVHPTVRGVECLHDGDAAADLRPSGPL
ncbi:unnamed protein product [Camellia sinensis]